MTESNQTTKTKDATASDLKALLGARAHELKTWPEYFEQIWNGTKTFEVRKNDRGYQKGDTVILREWDKSKNTIDSHKYTGRKIKATIGFVLSEMQQDGYVTFSLLDIEKCA